MPARWARHERAAFVDALVAVGPHAPTLCEGWDAIDLAAHVYVRERRPDALPGVLIPGPLNSWSNRVRRSAIRVLGWDGLLARLGAGPPGPIRLPPVDDLFNTAEFFVHTEDVLRAQPDFTRRVLRDGLDELLWSRTRRMAKLSLRRLEGVEVVLTPTGGTSVTVGSEGDPRVVVHGSGGELMLLLFNRKAVAEVEFEGDASAIEGLRAATLGP